MGGVQYGLLQARMSGRPTLIPTRIKPNCHVSDGSLIPASVPPSVALVCPPGWLTLECLERLQPWNHVRQGATRYKDGLFQVCWGIN